MGIPGLLVLLRVYYCLVVDTKVGTVYRHETMVKCVTLESVIPDNLCVEYMHYSTARPRKEQKELEIRR